MSEETVLGGQEKKDVTPEPTPTPGKEPSDGEKPSWRESLPEEIRDNPSLQVFTDVGALAKSFVHSQKLIGQKGVHVPGADAAPEEWEDFYTKIGRPEKDKYEIKTPEGVEVNQELIGKLKEVAFKNGMLPKQAQALVEWYINEEKASAEATAEKIKTETVEQLKQLRKEWGEEGFKKQTTLANYVVRDVVGEEFASYLSESGLGNDPQIIKAFAQVGKALGESKLLGDGAGKLGKTRQEAMDDFTRLQGELMTMQPSNAMYSTVKRQFEQAAKQAFDDVG